MNEKSNTGCYIDYINTNILPQIDYNELQKSYDTDKMTYARCILTRLHNAMADIYGSEHLGEDVGDEGFVTIPGFVRGRESGQLCLVLLDLDLSSSGEHWGTAFLCKYGVVSQSDAGKSPAADAMLKKIGVYDYCYTATIPGDIHVDYERLPDKLKEIMANFGTHEDVTDVHISAEKFESLMKELIPNAGDKAIKRLISYANELDSGDTYPRGAFFSETYVGYNIAAHTYGIDTAAQVLKICEKSCFNHWEILDAAKCIKAGISPEKIIKKAIDGELDLTTEQSAEMKSGLVALKNGTLKIPAAADKPSVLDEIRESTKAKDASAKDKGAKSKSDKKKSGPEH